MDLYDAYGRPIHANKSDPEQDQEHSDSSQNTATDKQPVPERDQTPTRIITGLSEKDSREHKAEQQRNYAIQQDALAVQRKLFWATLAAFGAAAYYALIAKEQLVTMNFASSEAHRQNIAQQRAILAVDGKPIPLRGGYIGLRIKNQGRLSANITNIRMQYEQVRSNTPSLFRHKEEATGEIVTPEEPFTLSFTPPSIPRLLKGERCYIRLEIFVVYDDGFGNTETVNSQPITPEPSYQPMD